MIYSASENAQIVVATQSPLLLDNFDPSQIRVLDREGPSSIIKELDTKALKNWLETFTLGEHFVKSCLGPYLSAVVGHQLKPIIFGNGRGRNGGIWSFPDMVTEVRDIWRNQIGGGDYLTTMYDLADLGKSMPDWGKYSATRFLNALALESERQFKGKIIAELAGKIGIPMLRSSCRNFNDWIKQLENIT